LLEDILILESIEFCSTWPHCESSVDA